MVKGKRKRGRKKGYKMSPATRAKIARAVKKAWRAGRYSRRKKAHSKRAHHRR